MAGLGLVRRSCLPEVTRVLLGDVDLQAGLVGEDGGSGQISIARDKFLSTTVPSHSRQ